jgi:hypothetical protein
MVDEFDPPTSLYEYIDAVKKVFCDIADFFGHFPAKLASETTRGRYRDKKGYTTHLNPEPHNFLTNFVKFNEAYERAKSERHLVCAAALQASIVSVRDACVNAGILDSKWKH